jgi:hypothetical protein
MGVYKSSFYIEFECKASARTAQLLTAGTDRPLPVSWHMQHSDGTSLRAHIGK